MLFAIIMIIIFNIDPLLDPLNPVSGNNERLSWVKCLSDFTKGLLFSITCYDTFNRNLYVYDGKT